MLWASRAASPPLAACGLGGYERRRQRPALPVGGGCRLRPHYANLTDVMMDRQLHKEFVDRPEELFKYLPSQALPEDGAG